MDKYKQILIDYANNRKALGAIKKKIKSLFTDANGKYKHIDLSGFREDWYGDDGEFPSPRWEGWVEALSVSEYEPKQLELAKLYDERIKIKREAGQLKRNMCAYGRGLIANG